MGGTPLAQAKLPPTASAMLAAEQAVPSAHAGLTSAQAKLAQVKAGPTAADRQSAQSQVEEAAASGLVASALALTVLFGLPGTLFGFVWAYWLTRRLRVLTGAVDAWSRGDLAVVARDASGDELGQLARQLNRMAE